MNEFWEKVKKDHFWAIFAQIWANERIFPKNLLRSGFRIYSPLTSCTIPEKTKMNEFWEKAKKAIFGHFLPKFGQTRIFMKNLLRSVFSVYSPLSSCAISKNYWMNFEKKQKKSIFGPFCPNLGKWEFSCAIITKSV